MNKPDKFPAQSQSQPGKTDKMTPEPEIIRKGYKGSEKLKNKVALITGGDSGIGRSVAVHFAREGADVAIIYLEEDKDARATKKMIEREGRKCLIIEGDLTNEDFCKTAVETCIKTFKKLNILVNNAAMQFPKDNISQINVDDLRKTFETNIYAMFYITKAAMANLSSGDVIINTSSVTAYRGSHHLLDYSST